MYSMELITSIDKWGELREEWNTLLEASSFNDLFLTFEWLSLWWETFHTGKLCIVLIKDKDKLVGILPFHIKKMRLMRVLCLIGTGESDYGGFIINSRYDACDVLDAAFEYIISQIQWDIMDLRQIPEYTLTFQYLKKRFIEKHFEKTFFIKLEEDAKCVYLPVPQPSDDIKDILGKKYLCNVRRYENKMLRSGKVSVEELKNPDDSQINFFYDMHIKRWETINQTSNFVHEKYRQFHSRVIKTLDKKGWLSFSALSLNSKIIAFSYNFVYNGKLYGYLHTFDIDYTAFGAGNVLALKVIDNYRKSLIGEIDFLRGDEPYKAGLSKSYRTNYRFLLVKKNLPGTIYMSLKRLRIRLRKARKLVGFISLCNKLLKKIKFHIYKLVFKYTGMR